MEQGGPCTPPATQGPGCRVELTLRPLSPALPLRVYPSCSSVLEADKPLNRIGMNITGLNNYRDDEDKFLKSTWKALDGSMDFARKASTGEGAL